MPKPNQKASHGTMVDMVVMEVVMVGMAASAVLLTLKLRANHTTTTGIIHMVDITGVRTTKDNETDLS